jgi:hypothetical protein
MGGGLRTAGSAAKLTETLEVDDAGFQEASSVAEVSSVGTRRVRKNCQLSF